MKADFTDLVLLVGTNPLPNYVVAKYFLKHNSYLKKIWLVHSEKNENISQEGTQEYAENLKNLLIKDHNTITFFFTALKDVSSSAEIRNSLRDKLSISSESVVHLNYTGGTKAMGIHVYRYIESLNTSKPTSYSYLDGRYFRLIQDGVGQINDCDLREEIHLFLEDMIKLHGFKKHVETDELACTDAVDEFSKLIKHDRLQEFYDRQNGFVRTKFENKAKPGTLADKQSQLDEKSFEQFAPNDALYSIVSHMPHNLQIIDNNRKINTELKSKDFAKGLKFIDGLWLESYVYKVLSHGLNDPSIEINKNWRVKKEIWSSDCELDLLLMRGYQFIGISCTTSDITGLCKSKGFEILHRSRQMGGEEAKAILITRLKEENRHKLKEELKLDTGGLSSLMVLGADSLKEEILINRINDFIFDRRYVML
ncbi:MAG: hypothetical protein AB2L14_22480 [Candidatus Xenobiia bacterium LiM19]